MTDFVGYIWNAVLWVVWVINAPTHLPLGLGGIYQVALWIFIVVILYKYTPGPIRRLLKEYIAPVLRDGTRRIRKFLVVHVFADEDMLRQPSDGEPKVIYRDRGGWTLKGVMWVYSFGAVSVLIWQYAAWPYIRASMPF